MINHSSRSHSFLPGCVLGFLVLSSLVFDVNDTLAAHISDDDVTRIVRELSLEGAPREQLALQLHRESSDGEHVLGILDTIAYGKKLYDPQTYRLSREWRKDDPSIDAARLMARLTFKETAKSLLKLLLGPSGVVLIDMVDFAEKLRDVRWRLEELRAIVETNTCQSYRSIRETSANLTPEQAWADMKTNLGVPLRPSPATPDDERTLHLKCEFQYVAFSFYSQEADIKQRLRNSLLQISPTSAGVPRSDARRPEPQHVLPDGSSPDALRTLAGRWDGANSHGVRFTWTVDQSGRYTSEFRQAGKEVRGGGRIVARDDGSITWKSETSPQTGLLTLSKDDAGRQVLEGTVSGRKDSFRLMQVRVSELPGPAEAAADPKLGTPSSPPADAKQQAFKLDLDLARLPVEERVRLFIEALRVNRFEHIVQLMGTYRGAILGIMNTTPRVLWDAQLSAFYSGALAQYQRAKPTGTWSNQAEIVKYYGNVLRPATGFRIMEIQKHDRTIAYVRFEYGDRSTAPGVYALRGGTGTGPAVRIAWFQIHVDDVLGTIGDRFEQQPMSFMEKVSELWK